MTKIHSRLCRLPEFCSFETNRNVNMETTTDTNTEDVLLDRTAAARLRLPELFCRRSRTLKVTSHNSQPYHHCLSKWGFDNKYTNTQMTNMKAVGH